MQKDEHQLQSQLEEDLFRLAALYASEKLGAGKLAQYADKEECLTLSPKKRAKILRRMQRQAARGKASLPRRRGIVAAASLLILLTGALAMQVEAVRIPVLNFFVELRDAIFSFSSGDRADGMEEPADWTNLYLPAYLPAGFHLTESDLNSRIKSAAYRDEQGRYIEFCQYFGNNDYDIDRNPGHEKLELCIGGQQAVLVDKDGLITIAWGVQPRFKISGNVSEEELIKTAQSVQLAE